MTEASEHVSSVVTGTAINIIGYLRKSPPGLEQSHELLAEEVKLLSMTDASTYPVQKKYHTQEFLRTIPHLRLRSPVHALIARLRSECEFHFSDFFRNISYVRVHPPLITSSDCEGAGQVFNVRPQDPIAQGKEENEFFGAPKYLTVSSQLHLEAYVHEHQAVWALSPTFRAERSDTPRHLSEFYMLEAELRTESLDDLMDLVEDLIRYVSKKVYDSRVGQELLELPKSYKGEDAVKKQRILQSRFAGLGAQCWPRITYIRAIALLRAAAKSGEALFQYSPKFGSGLHLEHEKYIAASVGQGKPVFVTDYPRRQKPFYMLGSSHQELRQTIEAASDDDTVACFDLLLPDLAEIVGGSLREHRLEVLEASMQARGLSTEKDGNMDWYLDLRRWGSVPHGGFGLGFDRLLCYLSGVDNVRDVVGWPRWVGRCDG